jgi:hypothetical protein
MTLVLVFEPPLNEPQAPDGAALAAPRANAAQRARPKIEFDAMAHRAAAASAHTGLFGYALSSPKT